MINLNRHFETIKNTESPEDFTNANIAINSLRAEHSEPDVTSEIYYKFTPEEIELAFNPNILSINEWSELSSNEKRKFLKVLSMYYEINLPKEISQVELDEAYTTRIPAFKIQRDLEDNPVSLTSESEDEENDHTKLEILISQKKGEFLEKNVEIACKTLGFDYQEFLLECNKRAGSEKQKAKCSFFFENLFNKLISFIKKDFENLNDNLQWYYHLSYENALPIKFEMENATTLELFDETIFELNPVEFSKIIQKIEDIRKMDDTRSKYKSWYDYYRKSNRDSR